MHRLDLTGSRFGRLTALERLPRKYRSCYYWRCVCDCGKECEVPSNWLTHGLMRSCGCLQEESRRRDVTGETRGHLTAIRPTGVNARGSTVWLWRCDCGREVEKPLSGVCSGMSTMCPTCARELKQRQALAMAQKIQRDEESGVALTQLDAIREGRPTRNNSTGVRGVTYHARMHRYQARASDHGKPIFLGTFATLEEAKKAREEAIKRLYGDSDATPDDPSPTDAR